MLTIDLSEKVVLVTGGSRGIGAGIVHALCQAGATTWFTHTGNPKRQNDVQGMVSSIIKNGGKVQAEVVNACQSIEVNALAKRMTTTHQQVHALICNVGQNLPRPAEKATDEEWRQFMEINLSSAFYAVRAFLPHFLEKQYGRIILIGSSVVIDGGGNAIDYAAGKSGLNGMSAYLTRNYARQGILTNVIHPCVIETDLLRERYHNTKKRAELVAQIPAGRLGRPEDIAGMVAYLTSSWGDFICGQSILIDGGRTLF